MTKKDFIQTEAYQTLYNFFAQQNQVPFEFQEETWLHILNNHSGIVNAPTGFGKTFSVFLGILAKYIQQHKNYKTHAPEGLQILWVTPLRALSADIAKAMNHALEQLHMPWQVAVRNGDTPTAEKQRQKKHIPQIVIITPETLHLLLTQKNNQQFFNKLPFIVVDEWHELMGSKRGVMTELAISYLIQNINKNLQVWGISATIGNLDEAKNVLLYPSQKKGKLVKAKLQKNYKIETVIPPTMERYPWAGHLGIKLAEDVKNIINQHQTSLIFINTRGMAETWYQHLLSIDEALMGQLALHHGSMEKELRTWVEDALNEGKLKAAVATSSLDLGVDFKPVEAVIQVGSPKGVARFLQRMGRSGHSPKAVSTLYFIPTHALELIEIAALKEATQLQFIESKTPLALSYDVLIQFMNTLAIGKGFTENNLWQVVTNTYAFQELTKNEWFEAINFITKGGNTFEQYDDFNKVKNIDGVYQITSRRMAMQHRMQIGVIVSDAMLKVKLLSGKYIGHIEEYFISRLQIGDTFTLGGYQLDYLGIKDMTVMAKPSRSKKSIVPSWNGGRMPLSANLGFMLRKKLNDIAVGKTTEVELQALQPIIELQQQLSAIPKQNELLIEHIETKDGFHLFIYPFEGRLVHEAMAQLLAFRLGKITPITFSIAMNDYGFELLSDQPIPLDDSNMYELFSPENLYQDITQSVNASEMAKRKFRDIAVIGGLVAQGMPGKQHKPKHLQASASLIFNVLQNYDANNLLLRQAYTEVMTDQMEETRLRDMLNRIQQQKILIQFPKKLTPFSFPIKVDSLRESMSSEKLEDRIKRMQGELL